MNILITAGGTTEKIDAVRSISNTGTGRLGALIAERLAASPDVERIFYVCNERPVKPDTSKAAVLRANDTQELEAAVSQVCKNNKIDAIVHSMAVSDYRTRTVTTSRLIGIRIADRLVDGALGDLRTGDQKTAFDGIATVAADAVFNAPSIAAGGKISSDKDDLVVVMEKTPKIIAQLRGFAPEAVIVGFKLLSGVSEDVLIDTAYALLQKNACDYVLANDMNTVGKSEGHTGYLIDREKRYTVCIGKANIAEKIAQTVLQKTKKSVE
ncbi:MAG: phosphopantothenate--cysteine ligase [Clostridiales Family XIII bacterium]|jgi:phosphopantothenate-cysteine ligase|nr:phosphopantothenate--cysteine ligase [Clostridiales Family XIII bacterium]